MKTAKMFLIFATLLALTITRANALEPADRFRESSCSRNGVPVSVPAPREFIDSLKYFSAGSRYNFYNLASITPNYADMREDDLYYDACYSRNTTTTIEGLVGAAFGFGRPLGVFMTSTNPGIYFEGVLMDPAKSSNRLVVTMTLTDYKNFAFLVNCWTGVDQRAWAVVTRVPYLDSNAKRVIEEHAVSHGFKRENFMFIRHDNCQFGHGNPALGI